MAWRLPGSADQELPRQAKGFFSAYFKSFPILFFITRVKDAMIEFKNQWNQLLGKGKRLFSASEASGKDEAFSAHGGAESVPRALL